MNSVTHTTGTKQEQKIKTHTQTEGHKWQLIMIGKPVCQPCVWWGCMMVVYDLYVSLLYDGGVWLVGQPCALWWCVTCRPALYIMVVCDLYGILLYDGGIWRVGQPCVCWCNGLLACLEYSATNYSFHTYNLRHIDHRVSVGRIPGWSNSTPHWFICCRHSIVIQ